MEVKVVRGWHGREVIRRCKFRRRTKTVSILLREGYLRDDIPCGSAFCQSCVQDSPPLRQDRSHYLVPDANALLQFLEIWELPQITSVIYLASVVKEVLAHTGQRNYRRIRSLYTDRRRQSLFFDDEHFIYTWSLQKDGDNVTEPKQSCKRVEAVAGWFYDHLKGAIPIVVVHSQLDVDLFSKSRVLWDQLKNLSMTDSRPNRIWTLEVLHVDTYFKEFWHHDSAVSELYASLAQTLSEREETENAAGKNQGAEILGRKGGKRIHRDKEYLPAHVIEAEVAKGTLRVGVFHVNRQEPLEGYVHPSNKGEASQLIIHVPGRQLQNRALPGDIVAVRMLHRTQWVASKTSMGQAEGDSRSSEPIESMDQPDKMGVDSMNLTEGSMETEDEQETFSHHAKPTGEVVGILQRCQRDYVACIAEEDEDSLRQSTSSRQEHLLCVPMDRRVPMVRISTRLADRLIGQRFVIRIDGWDEGSRVPRGHFVQLLGPIGDLNSETMALLVENGIKSPDFSSSLLKGIPEDTNESPWFVPDEEFHHRRDLRFSHRTCSIDPPGSKDVDDALSIRRLPNNILEVAVHIADVSYFVHHNTLLDLEARARGSTVYMVGKSWHMLPKILSENLCSLLGGKDRLAVSVIWTVDLDHEFKILNVWFGRTIIRSQNQMTYAQAQAILDGQKLTPDWELADGPDELAAVKTDLQIFAKFAQVQRDIRKSHGAVDLTSSELSFETKSNKEPVNVYAKLQLPMNWIVAELMILANSYVAMKIYQVFPSKSLLRRHAPPKLDNFTLMLECCEARGFVLDTSSNKALATSLDRMRDSNDPIVENAFRALATRAMSEAEYCSTGEATDISGFYHYGLALKYYTHFTSPIRRYADVLVHRILMASCKEYSGLQNFSNANPRVYQDSVLPGMELKEVLEHLNERHRASKRAQKECNELYLLMYLQKHAKAEHAVVIKIHEKGIMVFVPKYDIRISIFLQDKKGNIILPDQDGFTRNDDYEIVQPTPDSLVLLKKSGCIMIMDTSSKRVLHEFKLMDTTWVQLRADGSRAHAPKLRAQLLSSSHSAVENLSSRFESQSQTRVLNFKDDRNQFLHGKLVARKVDKERLVDEMVQTMAAEDESPKLKEKDSFKRKERSIHFETENFKRLKASSVYLDVIKNFDVFKVVLCSDLPETDGEQRCIPRAPVACEDSVNWMPLTVGMKLSHVTLKQGLQLRQHIQRLWLKELSRAAKVRAVHLRTVEDSRKRRQRADQEKQLRLMANIFRALLV